MAGCNSGSCDSMASTASNHSQRVSNPGVPSPAHPSGLGKDLGQIPAQTRSPSLLWRQLEALRQQQEQMNSCPRALPSCPATCVLLLLLQGLLWASTDPCREPRAQLVQDHTGLVHWLRWL